MKFFVSKIYYLFYSILGFIISIIFIISLWNDLVYRNKGYQLMFFVVFVFISIGIYFYLKSKNKKALVVIDDEKILIVSKSKSYYFEDLSFYRQEKILVRTSFEYIHFYDNQKNRIFYFNLDEIENKDELSILIGKRLKKLK